MTEDEMPGGDSIRDRIGKILSDILSDKYDRKVTIQFVLKEEKEGRKIG